MTALELSQCDAVCSKEVGQMELVVSINYFMDSQKARGGNKFELACHSSDRHRLGSISKSWKVPY